MTNYFADFATRIRNVFWFEKLNRYLLIASLLFSLIILLIWRRYLTGEDMLVFTGFNLYPVQYLAVVLLINTVLSYFSYDKEKEISYLLLSANIFICFLFFCLEIFYLVHR